MIKDLSFAQEQDLASKMYYGGGYTTKYEDGGSLLPQGGVDFNAGPKDLQSSASTGNISGGTRAERKEARGLREKGSGPNMMPTLGAGLGAAGSLISALDTNPDYDTADVAGSAVQFAQMGAAAGPIGAGVGALVGLGVGLIKKNKFAKEQKKIRIAKEQKEGYDSFMEDQEEFAGYAEGGVIKKYNHGGKVHSKSNSEKANTAIDETISNSVNQAFRNDEIKTGIEGGYSNLYTEKEIADATNPFNAYMLKAQEKMTPAQLAATKNTGSITQDKGMWNEDKGMIWNARNLLNEAVTGVQTLNLSPGGGGGRKNQVITAATEMFALPSINRLTKPNGDLEHIAHDPTNVSNYVHAGMNLIGAIPGASLVSKGVRTGAGKIMPALKGMATNTVGKLQAAAVNKFGESATYAAETALPFLHRTEKILHKGHQMDEISKTSYATGGMTQGSYSHATNPLTVVDKNGKNTGMELTGGEGVFDKPAMDKITKLLQGGRFDEVGSFVNNEMKTWKHK
tara:strand:- start:197 stop:1729 length:1533 start_codon:yes stop_codon:yes gene_type:complete